MSEENTFNTHENLKIEEIISKAFSIEDIEERAIFVEDECGGNEIMFEYVIESLDEMDLGETGVSDSVLESSSEVGNYTIIKKINEGGIATVYSAEHRVLKTLAAIKIFDKHDIENTENDLFWNTDHSSLARFNHDNIVKLYDVGEYEIDGRRLPYIAVEYVKGYHLNKFCESKTLAVREVLKLFQDLCEVIEFIHRKEILHLDLKPDNILVTANRPHRIKLIDFGSSKLFRSEHFTRWDLINPLTLKFAPPEQFDQNEVLTDQSDIYSLGVILYLLITKKVPFGQGTTDKVKITREVTDINLLPVLPSKRVLELKDEARFGDPLKTLSQMLSGDLDRIIMKALAKRRRNRYQSVSELRRDIDNYLKGKPVKAGKKPWHYKISKPLAQILGFKGGLTGWEKWKSPLIRLLVTASLLALLGTAWVMFFRNRASRDASLKFEIGRTTEGPTEKGIVNIYCGPEAQEKLCFTFIKVPPGNFLIGSLDKEPPKPEFKNINNGLGKLRMSPKFAKLRGVQAGPSTSKDPVDINTIYTLKSQTAVIPDNIYMGKFEITNRQWNIVAEKSFGDTKLEVSNDDGFLPKTNVTYKEAVRFCNILTTELQSKNMEIRLPKEGEWESACKAGSVKVTEEGNAINAGPKAVNALTLPLDTPPWAKEVLENVSKPWPESSFPPNTYGLVGMNGNVWELVTTDPEQINYGETQKIVGTYVLRGGAYNEDVFTTQCFYRRNPSPMFERNGQTGFRVVMTFTGKKADQAD